MYSYGKAIITKSCVCGCVLKQVWVSRTNHLVSHSNIWVKHPKQWVFKGDVKERGKEDIFSCKITVEHTKSLVEDSKYPVEAWSSPIPYTLIPLYL